MAHYTDESPSIETAEASAAGGVPDGRYVQALEEEEQEEEDIDYDDSSVLKYVCMNLGEKGHQTCQEQDQTSAQNTEDHTCNLFSSKASGDHACGNDDELLRHVERYSLSHDSILTCTLVLSAHIQATPCCETMPRRYFHPLLY